MDIELFNENLLGLQTPIENVVATLGIGSGDLSKWAVKLASTISESLGNSLEIFLRGYVSKNIARKIKGTIKEIIASVLLLLLVAMKETLLNKEWWKKVHQLSSRDFDNSEGIIAGSIAYAKKFTGCFFISIKIVLVEALFKHNIVITKEEEEELKEQIFSNAKLRDLYQRVPQIEFKKPSIFNNLLNNNIRIKNGNGNENENKDDTEKKNENKILNCLCGDQLIILNVTEVYCNKTTHCNICEKLCEGAIYLCLNNEYHEQDYKLCYNCGLLQKNTDNLSNFSLESKNKTNFPYEKEAKELLEMGFAENVTRELLLTYQGNVSACVENLTWDQH